jgi:hypothetical protein
MTAQLAGREECNNQAVQADESGETNSFLASKAHAQ